MNDTPDASASEAELSRRLEALGATATVDPEAWDKLQSRIADRRSRRRRPTPRQLMAMAAVIIVLGAILLARRGDDGRVETGDDTDSTIEDAPTDREATTTLPTAPGDRPTGSSTRDVASTRDGANAPGAGSAPSGAAGSAATTSPPTTAPVTAGGKPVWVTYVTPEYVLQGTFEEIRPGTYHMNIWRPDRGHLSDWLVGDRPGQNCLAGVNGLAFEFPEPGPHAYSWGLVRSDAAEVRIVTTTGEWTTAVIGSEAVPGIRPWIARRYTDQVSHYLALDANGNVLHDATPGGQFGGPDAWPDTC